MATVKQVINVAILGGMLLTLFGCKSVIRMRIETDARTNSGSPFSMVVHRADPNALPSNDYREISESLFQNSAESTLLKQAVLLPGQNTLLEIESPDTDHLVVYFLFTEPGPRWYFPFQQPLPGDVVITLQGNEIKRISADEPR